jgi:hypothetical protein
MSRWFSLWVCVCVCVCGSLIDWFTLCVYVGVSLILISSFVSPCSCSGNGRGIFGSTRQCDLHRIAHSVGAWSHRSTGECDVSTPTGVRSAWFTRLRVCVALRVGFQLVCSLFLLSLTLSEMVTHGVVCWCFSHSLLHFFSLHPSHFPLTRSLWCRFGNPSTNFFSDGIV